MAFFPKRGLAFKEYKLKSVVFVIPTKNEEGSLREVLDLVQKEAAEINLQVKEIIVVDDSCDATKDIAQAAGARVLPGGGRGLGEAMYRGLKEAAKLPTDYIVSMDSDGQADIKDLSKILNPLRENRADLVLTSRRFGKDLIKYKYPFINFVGVCILTFFLRRGTGLPLTDSHGGFRAMVPRVAEELEMIGVHTYVQETIFDAYDKGFRIVEIPSSWYPREGNSRVLHSITKYIISTLPVILVRLGWHRDIFLPLLVFLFFLGLFGIPFFSPVLSGCFIVLGFLGAAQIIFVDILWNIIRRSNDR